MNCCLKWVAFISSCLWFRSLPEKIRTEMGFESTHGNRLGLAVRRLNHSANLAMFIDKSQNLLSILHLSFSLHYQSFPTSSNLSAHISLLFFRTFLNQMFSRHWICCLTWGAFISARVNFLSPPKMFLAEMVLESRARDSIGVAVQSLNHSAILQPSFDKSQTMLSVLHLTFLLCITKFVQHLRIGVCSPSSVYFALFLK